MKGTMTVQGEMHIFVFNSAIEGTCSTMLIG